VKLLAAITKCCVCGWYSLSRHRRTPDGHRRTLKRWEKYCPTCQTWTEQKAHLRELREQRQAALFAQLPSHLTKRERQAARVAVFIATEACTRAQLRRVRWPWQARSERVALPRGRQGVALAAQNR
jgi:hypothetical protein